MTELAKLSERWCTWCQSVGDCKNTESVAAFDHLAHAYSTPPRAYHNLQHVSDCFVLFDKVNNESNHAIELAVWYHDAIYQPLSSTNEKDSADLMCSEAARLGIDQRLIDDAKRLILITAHHQDATASDEQMLADIDCSILAADPDQYTNYANAIRTEYSEVDTAQFCSGRLDFLLGLMSRDQIFHTQWALSCNYESRARANIAMEADHLKIQLRTLGS
jgi:predicted metal-dependent HD superfamily phosphohydrolase